MSLADIDDVEAILGHPIPDDLEDGVTRLLEMAEGELAAELPGAQFDAAEVTETLTPDPDGNYWPTVWPATDVTVEVDGVEVEATSTPRGPIVLVCRTAEEIDVTYNGGWETPPVGLVTLAAEIVASAFGHPGGPIASESVGGYSVSFDRAAVAAGAVALSDGQRARARRHGRQVRSNAVVRG